jgi:hypothetical protein
MKLPQPNLVFRRFGRLVRFEVGGGGQCFRQHRAALWGARGVRPKRGELDGVTRQF